MLRIRKLLESEIEIVKNFPPADWNFNYAAFLINNITKNYCTVLAAELNGKIAGVGNVFIFGKVAWLGNIIVLDEFRNKGIGTKITEELITLSFKNNCESILLIATQLGERVYENLVLKFLFIMNFIKPIEIAEK